MFVHTLKDIVFSISAANIVDIAIMALLVYLLLAWFTWTRAVQIMATLVAMGLFYFVASHSGLVLTSLLFQYLWAAIIMVFVIVFQPEIRVMLDRASPIRLWSWSPDKVLKFEFVEEIVKAVIDLARLRVGALIVFRRQDRLDEIILIGKLLDGLVSAEAVTMIFQRSSPLHDGAILIQQDRIRAAGCILPLSTDESLSTRYGTRHRAALGLTERSDALCIVVSEERGEVSLVENNQISNYRRKEEFRAALERGLEFGRTGADKSAPGVLDFLKKNWRLRILSVLTAIVLWFVIVGPQRSELGMQVPIQYRNLPAGMEITGKWMDHLEVRVRGSQAGLANLNPRSVRAVVDLGNVVTGLNYFRISNKNLQMPPGISMAKVRPSDLHLQIDAALTKKVRVTPSIVGNLPEGLRVSVNPSEVKVRALETDFTKLKSVVTEPVEISALIEKTKITIPVMVKPDGLRVDSVNPKRVTISVESQQN
jgi:diadenylate cyclase